MKKLIIMIVAISTPYLSSASEEDRSSLILTFAGVGHEQAKNVSNSQKENEIGFGAAALVEANLGGVFGIESGVIYLNRQYDYERAGVRLIQEVNRLHIPVTAKFWISNYFSLGVGPYASIKIGDTKNALEVGGVTLGSVNTAADDDVEFGLDATAAFNFAINGKTGIFAEARYSRPFGEDSDEDTDKVYGLFGLKVSL